MYLEGVIVCVNYSDFLAHTLPHNKNQFNNLVVVTDTTDAKTKELCEYHNVRCLQTDIFYAGGDKFNKGAAIDYGLQSLSRRGWVVHMDADIYLPPLTHTILENLPLQPDKIYGADRMMCPSYEEWVKFLNNPRRIQEGWVYVHMDAFPMGVRLAEYMTKGGGWEPIGYFQLWNPEGSGVHGYPTEHGFCDRTDVLHCKQFPRERRELLPEIVLIHLESEGLGVGEMGKNWSGRRTREFEPCEKFREPIDAELEPLVRKVQSVLEQYGLSYLNIRTKNHKMGWWDRLFTDGINVFLDRDNRVNVMRDDSFSPCGVRRYPYKE